jgi:hypothetical protein
VVEEWIDLHFFRPIGIRLARRLLPTRVTADQVTLAALVVGVLAGHLFLYDDWRLGALGFVLFVGSDVLDSADGQLARLRGTSTRLGRLLDGVSDSVRFSSLFLHLLARLLLGGAGWLTVPLVLIVTVGASLQAAAVDFMRQAYLLLGGPDQGELDLPEDLPSPPDGLWARLAHATYSGYIRRQAILFPATVALIRRSRGRPPGPEGAARYRAAMATTVAACAWIGQNMRIGLLLVTAIPGWPAGYFWGVGVGFTAILLVLRQRQERAAEQLAGAPVPGDHAYAT